MGRVQHGNTVAVDGEWLRSIRSDRRFLKLGAGVAVGAALAGIALGLLPTRTTALGANLLNDPGTPVIAQHGTPGSKLLAEYEKIPRQNEPARHRFVLDQVAKGNMPDTWDDWVTVTVTGQKGTIVEFEASPHGLRIGTTEDWIEVPMDGPHFAAVAEILDLQLATAWMAEEIYRQAKRDGAAVHYYAAAEIAHTLGYKYWDPNAPDGQKMKGPEFFRQRSALVQGWLKEHNVRDGTLEAGYFKTVVPPIDGLTRSRGLEMVGGYDEAGEKVQPISGGFHHRAFFDYSHNIRLVKPKLRVDGQTMTVREFYDSVPYAMEFGFRRTGVPLRAYPYPDALADWMEKNGHLKYSLDAELSKTVPKRSKSGVSYGETKLARSRKARVRQIASRKAPRRRARRRRPSSRRR